MSLNSDSERGSVAVPRLAPSAAGYATWAPRMTVVLQQRGAEGIDLKNNRMRLCDDWVSKRVNKGKERAAALAAVTAAVT
jgi:hypothetical protein